MDQYKIWNILKSKVLLSAGIKKAEAKDCKTLALLISQHTYKRISETTIKRIFGFAAANFEASIYTKNALSQYCGYQDWQDFVQAVSARQNTHIQEKGLWQKLREETQSVNYFMLSAVKNKAVIPFSEMVERELIQSYFKDFSESGALATVLSAPTGYGKTIAVCQWIDKKLNTENDVDIVLYLNSSFLLSSLKSIMSLNYWMMKLTGLETSNQFRNLIFEDRDTSGKFYFIIDGFDELSFRRNEFELLIHLLQNLLSIYKTTDWFKIVVIMRNSTWQDWKFQLMIDPDRWFIGKMDLQGKNMELFTQDELIALINMDRPFTSQELAQENFALLRYPLFHQIFYKYYRLIIHYDQFNELLIYDLISHYITENIVYGNQGSNKMDLIFTLLRSMEYNSGNYRINKSRIQIDKSVMKAYLSLIRIGFLREVKSISALHAKIDVYFSHIHFLCCCVAVYILKGDPGFSPIKLEYIQQHWNEKKEVKINIVKWCVFQSFIVRKHEEWRSGLAEYLPAYEFKMVKDFISQLENKDSQITAN